MMLWILLTAMAVIAVVGLTIPLFRPPAGRRERGGAVEVLRAQLAEIGGQARTGSLTAAQAEGLRLEIERRILVEGGAATTASRPLGERSLAAMGIALVAIVTLAATVLYALVGRPDLADASTAVATGAVAGQRPAADFASLVAQLEARMKRSPNDPQGWRMLGWSYMQLSRYAQAADAYGRAAALDPTNAQYPSARGEALTQAAGGEVTGAARTAFEAALKRDPADPRARYFLAMAEDQKGDHAGALADWVALLKSAPPDAPWVSDVRASIERIARKEGEDLAGLSPAPGPAASTSPKPDAGQAAMIAGMVDRLAARLKANPRDPDGWLRLMRARMVLGQAGQAQDAYRDALAAYPVSPTQRATFRTTARALGIPGA